VGFGGECGGSRAPRADGAVVWAWDRRAEQLARMERDWAAHTTALETADAAKWVNRQENRSTQPRATIDQHAYIDRSLRETDHVSCRAVSGAPAPLETPKSGGWDRPPGFVTSCYFRFPFPPWGFVGKVGFVGFVAVGLCTGLCTGLGGGTFFPFKAWNDVPLMESEL